MYSTHCNDTLKLCNDNFDEDFNAYPAKYFYMETLLGQNGHVPEFYYCNWTIGLDNSFEYEIIIEKEYTDNYTDYVFIYRIS